MTSTTGIPEQTTAESAPAAKTETRRHHRTERQRRCLRNLLLVIVATTCLNAAIASLLITWRAPAVVSFDMKETLDRFTEQAGSQSLDEAQTKALTSRFMTRLSAELHDWQVRHDALILVSPAVVAGAPDITAEIQDRVAQRMASGEKEHQQYLSRQDH